MKKTESRMEPQRDPWTDMEREMTALRRQLLQPLFGDFWPATREGRDWRLPRVDIRQVDNAYEVSAELPGVPRDRVNVTVSPGRLEIQSEAEEVSETTTGYRYRETTRRSFYRSLPIPEDADINHAEARMHDGVLEVRLPQRAGRAVRRNVPVR